MNYFKYLGRFWDDFPNRDMIEDVWEAFQPYVDSAVAELGSYMDMYGAKPSVYCTKKGYVHEGVDADNLNTSIQIAHGHADEYTSFASSITVSDATAIAVHEVYVNGVRIPDSAASYSVAYGTSSFSVAIHDTGLTAADKVCIRYLTSGTGKHGHGLASVDINTDASSVYIESGTPAMVFINGVLYDAADWSYAAGTLTLAETLSDGDKVEIRTQDTTTYANHSHSRLYAAYGALTTKVSAHFDLDCVPFINGVLSKASAGVYGRPPLEMYLIFGESFSGFYSADLILDSAYKYKSKLSTDNIVRLVNASDAVYTGNQTFTVSGYTIRDGTGAWFYHDDEISGDLYCAEVWYDESIPYLLFGSKAGFSYDYVTDRYMRMLKGLLAYRLNPKSKDNAKKIYSAMFDVPLNLIASDSVSDISQNDDSENIITMSSGATYNIKHSNAIVAIGDTLNLLDPLCDAIEVSEVVPVINTVADSSSSFNVIRECLAAPSALRRMPTALTQAQDIDYYGDEWGWYFSGPWGLHD